MSIFDFAQIDNFDYAQVDNNKYQNNEKIGFG